MGKIIFDKMQLEDLDEVHEIEINNYPVPWSKGIMKDCLSAGYHAIIVRLNTDNDASIIGYSFLMTAYDESHLLNMCIDKKHQGMGLGRKLLQYMQNICIYNQSKNFLLEVRESNPIARNLYESFGFSQIGIRKNYYQTLEGRENAIVMNKHL